MKQTRPSTAFVRHHSTWLAQFDSATLLSTMLDLCESAGIYIVDKNQQVLYWSLGMEKLTGMRQGDVVGKPCINECAIVDAVDDIEQLVKLSRTDGIKIELKKSVRGLFDKTGLCRRIGLLAAPSVSAPNTFAARQESSSPQKR